MNPATQLIDRITQGDDQSNLCVVLRPGDTGLEACLVADEKGRWSIPGGHAKGSESHAEACKREVKEETGLDIQPEPLFLAAHAARKLPVTLFYAVADAGAEGRPGGGDVTKVRWTPVTDLGDLNGTDRLAIQVAANRVHRPQTVVDDEVEVAEQLGFAVGNVAAPITPVAGIYFRINGKSAQSYARRLSEWAESLGWPTTVIATGLFESTQTALERAHKARRLTPMLHCLLHASDALWRYESAVAPALTEGRVVLEIGPEIDRTRFDALAPDVRTDLLNRIPQPTTLFTVGEDFDLAEFQVLKDSIEQMKNPEDPEYHLNRLQTRDVQVPWKMEFVRANPDEPDNPIVRCPKCKHEAPLMNDFSYLKAGFNGIQPGDEDDLDAQECGMCGAKMEWKHIDESHDVDAPGNLAAQVYPEAYRFLLEDPNTPDEFIRAFFAKQDAEISGDTGEAIPVYNPTTGEWYESAYAKGFSTRGGKVNVMWERYNENEEYELVDEAEIGSPKEKYLEHRFLVYEPAIARMEYAEESLKGGIHYDPLGIYSKQWPPVPLEQEVAEARTAARQAQADHERLKAEAGVTDG